MMTNKEQMQAEALSRAAGGQSLTNWPTIFGGFLAKGMAHFTYHIQGDTHITFPSKPPEEIRSLLKGAGFRWPPSAGCWWRRGCQGAADFIAALDKRMNPDRTDGACWRCQSPEGFFRRQGAATPVYWAVCFELAKAGQGPLGKADGAFKKPEQSCAGKPGLFYQAADLFDLDYESRCRAACGL